MVSGGCLQFPHGAGRAATKPALPASPVTVLLVQPEPGGPAVVQVEGDLDVLTALRLAALLARCDSRDVVVDVRAVSVLGAADWECWPSPRDVWPPASAGYGLRAPAPWPYGASRSSACRVC